MEVEQQSLAPWVAKLGLIFLYKAQLFHALSVLVPIGFAGLWISP
jgi:hypothetical protein